MLLQPALCHLLLLPYVLATFTHGDRVCWGRSCVVRTDAGTLCFEPQDSGIVQEECPDGFLKNLTHVHLKSTVGRSIAYYDDKARMLGAATWSIPHDMAGSVFVCMTGRRLDDPKQYLTVCRETKSDDDMKVPSAHIRECVSDQKPQHVGDGCFSLGKPAGGEDHKEWYEQPVFAGLFYLLGALVTLEKICLWVDYAARAVHARLPRVIVVLTAAFELLVHHWRRAAVPLRMQQPAVIA